MTSFKNTKKDETFKDLKAKNMKELIDRNQDNYAFFLSNGFDNNNNKYFPNKGQKFSSQLDFYFNFLSVWFITVTIIIRT